jgi:cytochrome c peroxidase
MFQPGTKDRVVSVRPRSAAAASVLLALLAASVHRSAFAAGGGAEDTSLVTRDRAGALATVSPSDLSTTSDGFSANLGTNGRSCATCHVAEDAWTLTPKHARSLASSDPLFAPNDGSDCPPAAAGQGPDSALSSELLDYGVIRVQLAIPATANFSLAAATNPKGCAIPPGSAAVNGQLFLFRRPLPTTNLVFDSAIMWDGRETLQPIATQTDLQSKDALRFDLADQANSATTGHAQGASIAGTQAQADIVAFEAGLATAQLSIGQRARPVFLNADGAHGGPDYLRDTVAPRFFIGVNDPLKPGFTAAAFGIFGAWEPTAPGAELLAQTRRAIGRGEAIFNNTTFVIHDVPGLNSFPSNPLYNPSDPFAGQDIVGGCGLCHNNPNVGNHSTALAINIGVTMAHPTNNDGTPNTVLDVGHLPVYTLENIASGASVDVTDPGKAMISGKWTDIGKTKGPMLRGLGARPPYFHNGSAHDLRTVVKFYNARFNMGLTPRQSRDLVTFLGAL